METATTSTMANTSNTGTTTTGAHPRREKQKFKDSCNSCATSKVRCSKTRPVCTRCQDRGLACHYSPSHRWGRRPASANTAPKQSQNSSTPSSNSSGNNSISSTRSTSTTPTPAPGSPIVTLDFSGDAYPFSDFSSDQVWKTSPLMSLGDSLLTDMFSESNTNTTAGTGLDGSHPWFGGMHGSDIGSGSSLKDFDFSPGLYGSSTPGTSIHGSNTPGSYASYGLASISGMDGLPKVPDFQHHQLGNPDFNLDGLNDWNCSCNCVAMALNLLAVQHGLSSSGSSSSSSSSSVGGNANIMFPSVGAGDDHSIHEGIIEMNKSTLQNAMTILSCTNCTSNEQVSYLIALVAFKVIERYAAVARGADGPAAMATPDVQDLGANSKSSTSGMSGMDFDFLDLSTLEINQAIGYGGGASSPSSLDWNYAGGSSQSDSSAAVRAQIVLGELHRVVRLAEVLSKRIEESQLYNSTSSEAYCNNGDAVMSGVLTGSEAVVTASTVAAAVAGHEHASYNASACLISPTIFLQLVNNIKERLRAVTREATSMLRHF